MKSLIANGYIEATDIQEKVLKLALQGHNIVGQSNTGTGKTAAFLLPILQKIDTNATVPQALILAPTRELVTQIADEVRNLTKFYGVKVASLYGGASPLIQKQNLQKKPIILVATPGRLLDFINQGVVKLNTVNYFVLDEVDRMLDMGFVRDIERIWATLTNVKQTFTFSATLSHEIKTIIKSHVPKYEFIKVGEEATVDKIDHRMLVVDHEEKLYNVIQLLNKHNKEKIIIFTHTKRNTQTISKILQADGFSCGMLNGDMAQGRRQATLNDFKANKTRVLVTTDVAARGLNMDQIDLVINFDVPIDAQSYIHRIGRTGRNGESGRAIMLVSDLEVPLLRDIEKMHKIRIPHTEEKAAYDREGLYRNLRLNRSTDKKWKKTPEQRAAFKKSRPARVMPEFDDTRRRSEAPSANPNQQRNYKLQRPKARPSAPQWAKSFDRPRSDAPGQQRNYKFDKPRSEWTPSRPFNSDRPKMDPSKQKPHARPFRGMGKPNGRTKDR